MYEFPCEFYEEYIYHTSAGHPPNQLFDYLFSLISQSVLRMSAFTSSYYLNSTLPVVSVSVPLSSQPLLFCCCTCSFTD